MSKASTLPGKPVMLRGFPARGRTPAVVAIVVCGVIAFIALFDWNWLRGPVAAYASAGLGRTVHIEGDLRGEFAFKPRLTADSVVVDNVLPDSDPEMFRAQRVTVRIDLWSLLRGPLRLPEVRFDAPHILLERDAAGRDNWTVASTGAFPRIGTLDIRDGNVHYRDPARKADITADVNASPTTDGGAMPVRFKGKGVLNGSDIAIEGSAATLLVLDDQNEPYRIDTKGRFGSTTFRFNGNFVPARPDNVDGTLALEGRDLSQLYPTVPVPFPWTPPYRLDGQLRHQGAVWTFANIKGTIGNSDVAGTMSFERKAPRPYVVADIVSQRLDYKDLGGVVGLPPPNVSPRARTMEQNKEAAKLESSGRVLPGKPLDLARLQAVDAAVHLRGAHFTASELPLDNLDTRLDLRDGILTLAPLNFGVGGGKVISTMTIDARKPILAVKADATVSNVEVGKILPELRPPSGSAGKLGGRAQFTATGNSLAQLLATANGEVAFISAGGHASELAVVLSNLDLARAAQLLLTGDAKAPIHCLVANLAAENGVMAVKTLVVDTSAEKITGSGLLDFRDERYDLELKAESKKPSLLALRGPINVEGTFKSPRVGPAPGPLAARVATAVALGALLTPVAALLPLIDFGGASDADCRALIDDASANVRASANRAAPSRKGK